MPPWLGRRRGWMVVTQTGLALALALMAMIGPFQRAQIFAALALGSPSFRLQDIVYDAYRTDEVETGGAGVWMRHVVMGTGSR